MKKILSLFLVFLTFLTLVLPVFAIEDAPEDAYASLMWIDYDYSWFQNNARLESGNYVVDVKFIYDGVHYDQILASSSSMLNYKSTTEGKQFLAHGPSGWRNNADFIYLTEAPDSLFMEYINSNGLYERLVQCNGNGCSVSDYNLDEICDTCGSPLARSVVSSFRPTNFPSSYPSLPIGYDNNSHYILFQDGSDVFLYTFTAPNNSDVVWLTDGIDDTHGQVRATDSNGNLYYITFREYYYDDLDNTWGLITQNDTNQIVFPRAQREILYSTLNLYDGEGNLFFPPPYWKEITLDSIQTLKNQLPTMRATMATLTIAGLSLIASLVGLILLLRLFKKFPR